MKLSVVALLACLMLSGSHAFAQQSVQACVNPASGEVKLLLSGGSCPPGRVAVTLAAGSGAADGRGPRILDDDDNDVGAFVSDIGFGRYSMALRLVGTQWLVIPVNQDGFVSDSTDVYFESTDCSGAPLLHAQDTLRLARFAVLWNGLLRFSGDPIPGQILRSVRSRREDGSLGTCFSGFETTSPPVGPEETVNPATFGLNPPFRIVD